MGKYFSKGLFLVFIGFVSFAEASTKTSYVIHQTPSYVSTATDLGPEDQNKQMNVRVWLKRHNPSVLSQYAEQVVSKSSGKYHKWMTKKQFDAKFAPTAQEVMSVQNLLTKQGLAVISSDPGNLFVTAKGSVGDIQKAFHTHIRHFSVRGKNVRGNTTDPSFDGSAGSLIMLVGGLSDSTLSPHLVKPIEPDTGKAYPAIPLSAFSKGLAFETQCFRNPESKTFVTADKKTTAVYTGNRYGTDLADTQHMPSCGYGPSVLQTAYGMNEIYKKHDGSGQTIVIVDAFGSPTAQVDLAAFSNQFHLPPPNIKIVQPAGAPVTGTWSGDEQGWAGETTLDIEYAHTMAPGANITLVEALTPQNDDLAAGVAYAVENELGNVISLSFGGPESQLDSATKALYDMIFQSAVVKGIAVNVSSGDDGDFVNPASGAIGYSDVAFPSDSPYVTAVGGTSLAVNPDNTIAFQTGWGTNSMRIADEVTTPTASADAQNAAVVPPLSLGFVFGAGGGTSRIYTKPKFQKSLSGSGRMVPDISFVGDPYTGVAVIESSFDNVGNPQPGNLTVQITGGTSLSTPMFSAVWAVANQSAGKSLGQAAPLLYRLPPGAVTDVVPVDSPYNVNVTVSAPSGIMTATPLQLALPETAAPFISTLYDNPISPYRWYVLTFGTDSSLATASGWDAVTGLGTPNGKTFIDALSR